MAIHTTGIGQGMGPFCFRLVVAGQTEVVLLEQTGVAWVVTRLAVPLLVGSVEGAQEQ